MSDEEKRWPFDGFYLKLAEAQREYEQEQHIDPASLTEEERQQKNCRRFWIGLLPLQKEKGG